MGGVRAKIGLTGQLDRRQPGNYFKPWLMEPLPEGWNICRECLGAVLHDITVKERFISPGKATEFSSPITKANKQTSQVAIYFQTYSLKYRSNLSPVIVIHIHLILYIPEVQIVHNHGLLKGERGGERLSAACKFFRISCFEWKLRN